MAPRASASGGVPVFSIGGRLVDQRERLLGMTDEERRWRAQFLKDQKLAPDEPRFSPELYKATNNIFRRTMRYPLDIVTKIVTPVIGAKRAPTFRFVTGKLLMLLAGTYYITYYIKYNVQDWTRTDGWYLLCGRAPMLPGDPGYPNVPKYEKHEYFDVGFSKSIFFKSKPQEE